ncbi:HAT, C-terminal dimerisation domain,Domain of unknown function DUF4371 [Cinara cedri]|uniref:HAT C-terminal dimerisation domain-containing protein n=1 Tax=Cinara cedri TaxID=506608 RepID=A0A5E4N0K2_9HEMI|nr:HAT, C-terminal dimerisation domain,Domain of unknown function DUF4371 [Cinara cedri]
MANISPSTKNSMEKSVSSARRVMIVNSYKAELRKNPKLTVQEARIFISKQLGTGQRTVSNVISEYNSGKTVTSPSKTRNKPSFKDNRRRDTILNDHLQNSPTNATYVSHRFQNELINICNQVFPEHLIKDVKESQFFSVIADESYDISGKEQLSLGLPIYSKELNVLADCAERYFKMTIFIRYVDSLILSLKERFPEENEVPYSIFQLLPDYMRKLNEHQYRSFTEKISKNSKIQKSKDVLDILKELEQFYSSVFLAICIGLSFPVTNCTAERSFSTLRRVKT